MFIISKKNKNSFATGKSKRNYYNWFNFNQEDESRIPSKVTKYKKGQNDENNKKNN